MQHLIPTLKLAFLLIFLLTAVNAQDPVAEGGPKLMKIAILPFENKTPNPAADWISNLFIESYKNELQKHYIFEEVTEDLNQKAIALLDEYKLSGEMRYKVYAALTRSDLVIGGLFGPAEKSEEISIQSQIFFSRKNQIENLYQQITPVESNLLFSAIAKSGQESVQQIRKKTGITGTEKVRLSDTELPRLTLYMVAGEKTEKKSKADSEQKRRKLLANTLSETIENPETMIWSLAENTIEPLDADPLQNETLAQSMKSDGSAMGILFSTSYFEKHHILSASIYETGKPEPLITLTTQHAKEQQAAKALAEKIRDYLSARSFGVKILIQGLRGKNLRITRTDGNQTEIEKDGVFDTNTEVRPGDQYNFEIVADPHSPSQRCFILNGTGKVSITGAHNLTVVCIIKRYVVEGSVEGLSGGEVSFQLNEQPTISLNKNEKFRFLETLEDFEKFTARVTKTPANPPQQCEFLLHENQVKGESVSLRLYCMPLRQHWITLSASYPIIQPNDARPLSLSQNGHFPLNALNGGWGLMVGYWTKYFLKFDYLLGVEAGAAYQHANVDLITHSGRIIDPAISMSFLSVYSNLLLGYEIWSPKMGPWPSMVTVFVGFGPRYFRLVADEQTLLLNTIGPGFTLGAIYMYEIKGTKQIGLRYQVDAAYIIQEPILINHLLGVQFGYKL